MPVAKHFCQQCQPISFQNQILCATCLQKKEEEMIQAWEKKQYASPLRSRKVVLFLLSLVLISTGFYFGFIKPKEIQIPGDDRERINVLPQ